MYTYRIFLLLLFLSYAPNSFTKASRNTMVIGLMGDVMLGRLVNDSIDQISYAYPWGNIRPYLYNNDLNIINLETTLTYSTQPVAKVFNFKATPDKVNTLIAGNIHVVNLANNHSLDFSYEGLQETLYTLDKADIKHVGAGMNEIQARQPVIIEKNGIKVGILGFTDNEPEWIAGSTTPGINYIKVGDLSKLPGTIQQLKTQVDFVIITCHWGPNFREQPSQQFRDFAHALIDSGADIIHGHSAHILQPIEVYNNKLILYDTGDFIDDYQVDPVKRNDLSCLFLVMLDKIGILKVQLIPVIISQRQVNKASQEVAHMIIDKLQKLSNDYNTIIQATGEISLRY